MFVKICLLCAIIGTSVNGYALNWRASVQRTSFLEMRTELKMPALSSTMKEGKIVAWSKKVGDKVSSGDVLLVVESDKADMDVESFDDGYLGAILTPEGGTAEVGATVAIIVDSLDQVGKDVGPASPAAAAVTTPVPSTPAPSSAAPPAGNYEQILMPALSSTMKEGKIVAWSKKVGDKVSSGDVLLVVESDKADMDVESFEEGFLGAILVPDGGVATVGAPVALIVKTAADIAGIQGAAAAIKSGGSPAAAVATASTPAATPVSSPSPAAAAVVNTGRVAASGFAQAQAKEQNIDLRTVTPSRPDGYITSKDLASGAAAGVKTSSYVSQPGVVNASPMARKVAAENNVDISKVKGTGNFGRVLPDDVLIACGKKTIPAPSSVAAPVAAAASTTTAAPKKEAAGGAVAPVLDGVKLMDGMQKAVSKNMEKTLSIPVFRVSRLVNYTAILHQ